MASKKDAVRERSENVKTNIRSISTCTASTVAELQDILLGKSDDTSEKENSRTAQPRLARSQVRTAKKTTTTGIAAPTCRDRYILATEVANITLKSLADALKIQPPCRASRRKPSATEDAQPPTQPRQPLSRSPSYAQRPLQERCASQASNSPTKPPALRRSLSCSTSVTGGPDPGLVATAECARIAFTYLRSLEASRTAAKETAALQLESGILAFIGKLVAHGLDSLAVKELRVLKRRLDHFLGNDTTEEDSRSAKVKLSLKRTATAPEKESLAVLLRFGDIDLKSPALPLVVSHQNYVLRIIARIKRPRLVEEAWCYLKLSQPSSPANLMWSVAKASNNDPKAIRQLESLAHTVLSLCPSISRADDISGNQNNVLPAPDVVLSLQHLAFKTRKRWWALAHHEGSEEKELLEPFCKCMVAFARRSELSPVKKYRVAELLFTDLLGSSDSLGKHHQSSSAAAKLAAKTLSSLAQSAGLSEEALRWLGASSPGLSQESAAANAIRLIRAATLSFDIFSKEPGVPDPEDAITAGLEALSGSLGGTSSELDSLYMEANAFRRTAARALQASLQTNTDTQRLQIHAFRIVASTVHFIARFLDISTISDTDSYTKDRHSKRVSVVSNYLKSIIDSACICSKLPVKSDLDSHWKQIDGLLQDCVAILQHFQGSSEKEHQLPFELQQPFVKLSNAYWAAHLQLKAASGTDDSSLTSMQRSIDLLTARSQAEKHAGLLVMKLEKFAEALDSKDRVASSRAALLQCIRTLIDSGVLRDAMELAENWPIHRVLDSDESVVTLARVLKANNRSFVKFGVQDPSECAFFDDQALPAAGRGLLLEYQLSLFCKTLKKNRPWGPNLNQSIQNIAQCLEQLYSAQEFPIRRQRAQIVLFQLSQEHPEILPPHTDHLVSEPVVDARIQGSQDEGLVRFEAHMKALGKLNICMQESPPSTTSLRECCSVWQSLIDSAASWKEFSDRVDDIELFLSTLEMAADYLAAKGDEYTSVTVLYLLTKIMELRNNPDPSHFVIITCALASRLLRLGYTGKAGLAFAKTETLIANVKTSTEAKLHWHVGYAEYSAHNGDTAKCESFLSAAESIARQDDQFMSLAQASSTLSGRVKFNRILADACYVHSLLSINTGKHKNAARYAKQCVALNRRIWAAMESQSASKAMAPPTGSVAEGGTFDPLSSMRNDKGVPLVTSVTHESLDGPNFWPLIPRLYQALMQQSKIFAHQGLLQEAVYVAEQGEKVATAVQSRSLIIDNASCRAEYWVQGGRVDKAQTTLVVCDQHLGYQHVVMAGYYSALARICHSEARFDDEMAAYNKSEALLAGLSSPSFIRKMIIFSTGADSLSEKLSKISLDDSAPKGKAPTRTTRGRKPTAKAVPKASSKVASRAMPKPPSTLTQRDTTPSTSIADECPSLSSLQADVLRRKALVHLLQDKIPKACELLAQAQALERTVEQSVSHLWTSFKASLSQSMRQLATDFTFNTLPESTIAFPAIQPSEESVQKRADITVAAVKGTKGKKLAKDDFITTLREARERLIESHNLCAHIGSSASFQQASFALAHVTVVLSAVSSGDFRGSLHPLYAAYMSEIPKIKSLRLAQESIQVEKERMSREEYLKWPQLSSRRRPSLVTASHFQKDYVDIIPTSWTAISLALNEDRDELFITRYESGQSPFVLRLPMARHASRDMDEEEFSFDDGKRDFDEIIELSDFSTRSAKDMTSKEARAQWWEERQALDTRLHELLVNIENIWLGGFKGIFSQHPREPTSLESFHKSFEAILDRHLPSRGKSKKKKAALDPRVLDLFIGLGDATDEQLDLDEALMDLIYFVVDILQFNGERNAYDEIDFDAIVIETLDALRTYHNACQGTPPGTAHTILILDKSLHVFPWESLPCLQSLAISRLPSLQALRDRILAAKGPEVTENAEPGHYISAAAGGTSILNPSLDLTHTLKTIKPRLDDMQGDWTHMVSRAPSEEQFESALKNKDLLLYFGHGSGAQFVKSKSVRRLYAGSESTKPGCATTLLFGCSSVHLTENGIYESSGMLASYLTAGAPAVVGMLWDVTDKDCDRVAVKAGELWGLWPEMSEEKDMPKIGKKAREKKKAATAEVVETDRGRSRSRAKKDKGKTRSEDDGTEPVTTSGQRGVGLDEALRQAREECVLRYLNGAAAVVYGIPVYLE